SPTAPPEASTSAAPRDPRRPTAFAQPSAATHAPPLGVLKPRPAGTTSTSLACVASAATSTRGSVLCTHGPAAFAASPPCTTSPEPTHDQRGPHRPRPRRQERAPFGARERRRPDPRLADRPALHRRVVRAGSPERVGPPRGHQRPSRP